MEFCKVWNSQIVAFHSFKHHTVITSFSVSGSIPIPIESYELIHDDYIKLGKQILEETEQFFKYIGVPIEMRLIEDIKPEKYAIEVAKKENFDLIVLGSRRHHSKLSMVLGTLATHIVNNAECDVLIIR